MWHSAGICRSQAVLDAAIAQVEQWQGEFNQVAIVQQLRALTPNMEFTETETALPVIRQVVETDNLLEVARLILKSAAFRTESRGGHFRQDYPDTDPTWQSHTVIEGDRWSKIPCQSPDA
jgi:L-aspartate oxidase